MTNTSISFIQQISNFVVQIALGNQSCLHTADLSSVINFIDDEITLRDIVRTIFAELGIEIEFSGKGPHEKSVIIDIDEDRLAELKLSTDALRFGQTVVRADAGEQLTLTGKDIEQNGAVKRYNIAELIKETVNTSLGL